MERSNCLIFALAHLWHDGGYIVFRKSEYWGGIFGFHVLWSQTLEKFEEFTPLLPKRPRWFPPLLFKGYVQEGK